MQYSLLACMFLLIIYLINRLNKFNIEKTKKDYVSRAVHGDRQINQYVVEYNFDFFEMIQYQLKLADEYKLNKADKEQVMKILKEFKKDLSEKYFSNRIGLPKTKYHIDNDTFFMYSLYLFLDKRYCHDFFCEEPMHKETITHKNYDGDGYSTTYLVTEFAIIVFKLLYISYMYCKNSKTLNPERKFFDNEKYIEELIDTKKLSVSVYRP